MLDGLQITAPWILEIEGFWSNDPADRGGATQYGISLRYLGSLPDRDGDGFRDGDLDRDGDVDADDVRLVTVSGALKLFKVDFWDACRCDELPAGMDSAVFCAAVNHGPDTAKTLMQRALGVKADGSVGPVTLRAARAADMRAWLAQFCSHRGLFYHEIVKRDATQGTNLRGWLRRLFLLQQFVITDRLA